MTTPPDLIIRAAVEAGRRSPCAKSKRGAVVYSTMTGCALGVGWNAQPEPFVCTGSEACRAACGKLCVHAEARAIANAGARLRGNQRPLDGAWQSAGAGHGLELVHAKVVDGELVAGGGPSCWQCSREILDAGIAAVWLYEGVEVTADDVTGPIITADSGRIGSWRRYAAQEFHRSTAAACGLPPLEVRR